MGFGEWIQRISGLFSPADGLVLLLAVVTLWGIRRAPKRQFFEAPLNREQGLALRGVFACVVLMKHVSEFALNENGLLAARFVYWGPLAVSVFFGLSGYGVMAQSRERDNYLDGFLKKRFHALWWPYFAVMVLTFVQWIRGDFSLGKRLESQMGIVNGGWFWTVLMVFYVVFWLANRRRGQNTGQRLTLTIAGILLVTVLSAWLNWKSYHYCSNGAFVAGLVLGAYPEDGFKLLRTHWWKVVALMCFVLPFRLSEGMFHWSLEGLRPESWFFLHMFWFIGIAALAMKWQLGNRVLGWLGTISYELYLVHLWVMDEVLHWWPEWKGSGYAWTVVGLCLAMAHLLHAAVERWKRLTNC